MASNPALRLVGNPGRTGFVAATVAAVLVLTGRWVAKGLLLVGEAAALVLQNVAVVLSNVPAVLAAREPLSVIGFMQAFGAFLLVAAIATGVSALRHRLAARVKPEAA